MTSRRLNTRILRTFSVIERVMGLEDVDRECHRVMPRAFERDKVARVEGCARRVVTRGKTACLGC